MHRKHIFLGFLLGLAVGAYYHYVKKDTPKEQDGLYKLAGRVRGKVEEAKDENSDLHASINKASTKVKDVASDASDKAKEVAEQAGDKVKAKADDVSDDAAAKVQQVADAAAKHAVERTGNG